MPLPGISQMRSERRFRRARAVDLFVPLLKVWSAGNGICGGR
ncbi:hypothetical protein CVCC1112_3843 [Paenarthrobacter nicotinovorans]|nr:hypothetical protein CVCC1112_3843 [Paenarthrobacter nicotinovorans]